MKTNILFILLIISTLAIAGCDDYIYGMNITGNLEVQNNITANKFFLLDGSELTGGGTTNITYNITNNLTNNITNNITYNITNNFTIDDSSFQCSGTDKLVNVTVVGGVVTGVCDEDISGGSTVEITNVSPVKFVNLLAGAVTDTNAPATESIVGNSYYLVCTNISGYNSYRYGYARAATNGNTGYAVVIKYTGNETTSITATDYDYLNSSDSGLDAYSQNKAVTSPYYSMPSDLDDVCLGAFAFNGNGVLDPQWRNIWVEFAYNEAIPSIGEPSPSKFMNPMAGAVTDTNAPVAERLVGGSWYIVCGNVDGYTKYRWGFARAATNGAVDYNVRMKYAASPIETITSSYWYYLNDTDSGLSAYNQNYARMSDYYSIPNNLGDICVAGFSTGGDAVLDPQWRNLWIEFS